MTEYADVPPGLVEALRGICLALPETTEEPAWTGTRWQVRRRTFAHVLALDGPDGPTPLVTFRSSGDELDALLATGHPFFRAGWGTNVLGMVLRPDPDLDELRELLTESYCVLAPKKLAALVERPDA